MFQFLLPLLAGAAMGGQQQQNPASQWQTYSNKAQDQTDNAMQSLQQVSGETDTMNQPVGQLTNMIQAGSTQEDQRKKSLFTNLLSSIFSGGAVQ